MITDDELSRAREQISRRAKAEYGVDIDPKDINFVVIKSIKGWIFINGTVSVSDANMRQLPKRRLMFHFDLPQKMRPILKSMKSRTRDLNIELRIVTKHEDHRYMEMQLRKMINQDVGAALATQRAVAI